MFLVKLGTSLRILLSRIYAVAMEEAVRKQGGRLQDTLPASTSFLNDIFHLSVGALEVARNQVQPTQGKQRDLDNESGSTSVNCIAGKDSRRRRG